VCMEGLHSQLIDLGALDGTPWPHAAAPRELLCMACSPWQTPLRKARAEIVEVADACQWGADRVTLTWGGQAESLVGELRQRPTRRLLFAGHTDAGAGACALGFTSPGGGLEPLDALELVGHLGAFFPSPASSPRLPSPGHAHPRGVLELIVINGCHSEGLGRKLREHGAPCVVCWRTAARDDAARLFSVSFFRSLAALAAAEEPADADADADAATAAGCAMHEAGGARHRAAVLCARAFADAERAVCTATRRSRRGVRKFELADPEVPRAQGQPRYPLAAGIPVLLCDEAAANEACAAADGAAALSTTGGSDHRHRSCP